MALYSREEQPERPERRRVGPDGAGDAFTGDQDATRLAQAIPSCTCLAGLQAGYAPRGSFLPRDPVKTDVGRYAEPVQTYVAPTLQLVTEIVVRDILRSTDFYRSLGFELLRDGGDFVELTWEEHCLFLAELSAFDVAEGKEVGAPPPFPLANVRVMVPDVDECWSRANQLGARVVVPIGDRYYGLRDFMVADPDGFGVRFAGLLNE